MASKRVGDMSPEEYKVHCAKRALRIIRKKEKFNALPFAIQERIITEKAAKSKHFRDTKNARLLSELGEEGFKKYREIKNQAKRDRKLDELGPIGYRKWQNDHNARKYARKFKTRIWFEMLVHVTRCSSCGCNNSLVRQWHHFDRFGKISNINIKMAEIGNLVNHGKPIDVIMAELAKCIPLCSNCHDELHERERIFNRAKKVADPEADEFYRTHYNEDGSCKLNKFEEYYPEGFDFPEFPTNFDLNPKPDFTGGFGEFGENYDNVENG